MAILVFRIFTVVDGTLLEEPNLPHRCRGRVGDAAAALTNLEASGGTGGPAWEVSIGIQIRSKTRGRAEVRQITVPLQQFLSPEQYEESLAKPLPFSVLAPNREPPLNWLWLYRDGLYATDRDPRPSEIQEVILRLKSLHFQRDEALKRLKEQVANFEAIEVNLGNGQDRRAIADDVKLLVWARDGGACVKCGSAKELHFDHVIPLARGGSDEAENIQILCRNCNLAKSDRLA